MKLSKEETIWIGELMRNHIEHFGETKEYKKDFMFVNLLAGNDYFPKMGLIDAEKLWDAYKQISYFYDNGLLEICGDVIRVNKLFFQDLICRSITKSKKKKNVSLSEISKKSYSNYIEGLLWCSSMYFYGKCSDYNYTCECVSLPSPMGCVYNMFKNNEYIISEGHEMRYEIYGFLLTPYEEKFMNNETCKKLLEKFPGIRYGNNQGTYGEELSKSDVIEIQEMYDAIKYLEIKNK
jgi:hypothetical protein